MIPRCTDADYNNVAAPAVSVANDDDETPRDTAVPRLLRDRLWVDGATLTMTFNEGLDASSVPHGADFDVYASSRRHNLGSPLPLAGVEVSGNTVALTLQRPVAGAGRVMLAFNFHDGGTPLKDLAGNELWVGGMFGVDNRTVTVDEDPQTPGVTLVGATDLRTSEARGTASFYVVLDTRPSAAVTVRVSSSDETEGRVTTEGQWVGRFDFRTRNRDRRRKVMLTGVDDEAADGDQSCEIRFELSSADTDYDGIEVPAVPVINVDDDSANASPTVAAAILDVVVTAGAAFRHAPVAMR